MLAIIATEALFCALSGMGDSQRDSRESIRARESFTIQTPIFIARQADSPESLEFPIRANHATEFALFCALLRFFADLRLALVRAHLRAFPASDRV